MQPPKFTGYPGIPFDEIPGRPPRGIFLFVNTATWLAPKRNNKDTAKAAAVKILYAALQCEKVFSSSTNR